MSTPQKPSGKRKALTKADRMKVVERHLKGETCIAIATSLQVGKTQIQSIIREKDSVLARWESGERGDRKLSKIRKTTYTVIDEQIWEWFCDKRRRNVPVTGKLIQEKALFLSVEGGFDDFVASNGWLEKWLKRRNIHQSCLSGDREVSEDQVADWKMRLPQICEGYSPENVFNADETGLFYRAFPSKSMVVRGQDAAGIKIKKDRITALLCVGAKGETLKPLVIGRSAKPRCFQGIDVASLGVDYKFNKKAWMTDAMFTEWANKLNNKMTFQNRHILLFVDSCSARPPMQLSHVKFVFLPQTPHPDCSPAMPALSRPSSCSTESA